MITINPNNFEELCNEAESICSLAYTLQAALEGPQHSDYFTGASCILSDKMAAFVDTLKGLEGAQE